MSLNKAPQNNTAGEGDLISWYDPKINKRRKGKVIKVYNNSVLVDVEDYKRTVVSFRRYRVDKKG